MESNDMSPNTARKLAALIVAGAEQLEEKAEQQGVTAFLGRAVQRERPNERFLQNTLKNLASANRRADEKVMWAAWEAQKQLKDSSRERNSNSRRGRDTREQDCSRDLDNLEHSRQYDRNHASSSRHAAEQERASHRQEVIDKWRDGSLQQQQQQGLHSREQRDHAGSSKHHSGSLNGRCRSRSADGDGSSRQHKRRRRSRSISSRSGDSQDSKSNGSHAAAAHDVTVGGASGDSSAEGPAAPSSAAAEGPAADDDDQQLLNWLASSKKVRGRGSIGPRADLPGPYLKPPEGLNPGEIQQLDQGSVRGPQRPAWLKRDDEGDASRRSLVPAAGFLRGVLRSQGLVGTGQAAVQQGLGGKAKEGDDMRLGSDSGSGSSEDNGRGRKSSKHSRKHRRKEKHSRKHKKRKKEKKSRHKE